MSAWTGTPMQQGTALKPYSELCRVYGKKRTRLVVEVMPKAAMKTIDNEQDAQITIDNLAGATNEQV
jgi:hypothetical protein